MIPVMTQGGYRKVMTDRLLQTGKLRAFAEGDNRCCTAYIVRKVVPNLRASKAKLCLVERGHFSFLIISVTMPNSVETATQI